MNDPVTLLKIKETADALNRRNVITLEDVRSWLGKDVDNGIELLTTKSGTTQEVVLSLLIAEFCDDAGRSGKPKLLRYWRGLKPFKLVMMFSVDQLKEGWRERKLRVLAVAHKPLGQSLRQLFTRHTRVWRNWRRHWSDALVFVVLPILLVGGMLRIGSARGNKVPYVTVNRSVTLPAYHPITDQVELSNVPSGAFTSITQIQGRYALVSLPGGTTLLPSQLLTAELSSKMRNRKILTIPLKPGSYSTDLSAPYESILVFSPREMNSKVPVEQAAVNVASASSVNPVGETRFDVILLKLDQSGILITATLALQNDDFNRAAALLASHDAFLVQTAH